MARLHFRLWGDIVAKPEWGTKRACPNCGARFYDLQRSPVPCPKCGAEFDSDRGQRSRRPKASAPPPEKPPPEKPPIAASGQVDGADGGNTDVSDTLVKDTDDDDKNDGAGLIEGASELGEDKDDVSTVRGRGSPDKASD